MKNPVGPVLRMGDQIEDVIAAIRDDNPNQEIAVIDRGSYVRVKATAGSVSHRTPSGPTSAPTTRSGPSAR
jgi:hypothetical protein